MPEETKLVLPSLTLLPPLKRAAVWGECYLCMSCVWEVSFDTHVNFGDSNIIVGCYLCFSVQLFRLQLCGKMVSV